MLELWEGLFSNANDLLLPWCCRRLLWPNNISNRATHASGWLLRLLLLKFTLAAIPFLCTLAWANRFGASLHQHDSALANSPQRAFAVVVPRRVTLLLPAGLSRAL